MHPDTISSAEFVKQLAELAQRISAMDIVIASLHADFAFNRFWQIEVHKGDVALRFSWDARECELDVERCPVRRLSYPNDWKREALQAFDRRAAKDEPFRFVEDYVAQQFTQAA